MASVLRRAEGGAWSTLVTWSWWEATVAVAGALLVVAALREAALEPASSEGAASLVRALVETGWLVVLFVWIRARRHRWRAIVGRPSPGWAEVADGAVFGALLNGVVVVIVILPLRAVLHGSSMSGADGPARDVTAMAAPDVLAVLAFTLLVAPIAEELVFRGVLYRGVRDRWDPVVGTTLSALAFGAVHWVPFGTVEATLAAAGAAAMGVGLAIQYERRRTILAPIVAHVAFNAVGLLAALR